MCVRIGQQRCRAGSVRRKILVQMSPEICDRLFKAVLLFLDTDVVGDTLSSRKVGTDALHLQAPGLLFQPVDQLPEMMLLKSQPPQDRKSTRLNSSHVAI